MRIVVQKWMQAVLVPVAALVALYLFPKISHAVFIFLMAALFALLLNPVVMMLQRARIPRPVGVLGVYLALAVLLVVLVVIAVPPLAGQGRDLVDRAPDWYEEADVWLSGLQDDVSQKNVGVNVGEEAARVAEWLRGRASTMASAALAMVEARPRNHSATRAASSPTFTPMFFWIKSSCRPDNHTSASSYQSGARSTRSRPCPASGGTAITTSTTSRTARARYTPKTPTGRGMRARCNIMTTGFSRSANNAAIKKMNTA